MPRENPRTKKADAVMIQEVERERINLITFPAGARAELRRPKLFLITRDLLGCKRERG